MIRNSASKNSDYAFGVLHIQSWRFGAFFFLALVPLLVSMACYGPVGTSLGFSEMDASSTARAETEMLQGWEPELTNDPLSAQAALQPTVTTRPIQATDTERPAAEAATATLEAKKICQWELQETTDALATGGGTPGMSSSRTGGMIETSYTYAGNFGCDEQTFRTSHTWLEPGDALKPGSELSLEVSTAWDHAGKPECTSLTAGASTSITAGSTTINAQNSSIRVSAEPQGLVTESGRWVVPGGSGEGASLSITAGGSSGSLGGRVFYNYLFVCKSAP